MARIRIPGILGMAVCLMAGGVFAQGEAPQSDSAVPAPLETTNPASDSAPVITDTTAAAPAEAIGILPPPPEPEKEGGVYCQAMHEAMRVRRAPSKVDSIVHAPAVVAQFNSLFKGKKKARFVRKFKCKPPVFYGAAFKTMPYPAKQVQEKIQTVEAFGEIFKYIRNFQIISQDENNKSCLTAYTEVGAPLFKAWFIVNLDSIVTDKNDRWGMYFSMNHLGPLNSVWAKHHKPMFTYRAREILIQFFVEELGKNESRVGYLLAVDAKSKVPGWLFRLVGKWVFPRFMKDIENSIKADMETSPWRGATG